MATKRAAPAGIEIGVEHGAAPASEGGNGQSDALRCAAVKRRTKIKAGNRLTLPLARDGALPLLRCGRGAKHCPRTAEDLRFVGGRCREKSDDRGRTDPGSGHARRAAVDRGDHADRDKARLARRGIRRRRARNRSQLLCAAETLAAARRCRGGRPACADPAGADGIILADTVGYGNPAAIGRIFRRVIADVAPIPVAAHFHDTRGLGLANVLAAFAAGCKAFDASLGGLGGCPYAPGATGNIVLEDTVFMFESMGLETGIDLDSLAEARDVVARALPEVTLYGAIAKAGLPRNFHPVANAA